MSNDSQKKSDDLKEAKKLNYDPSSIDFSKYIPKINTKVNNFRDQMEDDYIIFENYLPSKVSQKKEFVWDHVPDLMCQGVSSFIWTSHIHGAFKNIFDEETQFPDLDLVYAPKCTTYIKKSEYDELRKSAIFMEEFENRSAAILGLKRATASGPKI